MLPVRENTPSPSNLVGAGMDCAVSPWSAEGMPQEAGELMSSAPLLQPCLPKVGKMGINFYPGIEIEPGD